MKKAWIKQTTLFLTGQTITLFGSSLVQFAIGWHITLTTKSGIMITIATLCGFLPQVVISLFAGVWADRFSRKPLIILSDCVIAFFTAILAVMFAIGYQEIWLLFVISAIRSLGAGVQTPSVSAFLTEIVPQESLLRVNGINSGIQSVMLLISPAAAGALYGVLGLGAVFWVDILTAIAGISMLTVLKVKKRELPVNSTNSFFLELLHGVRYVLETKWLKQFLYFYLGITLMIGPVVFLTPLMVARSFGDEAWRLVVHEMVFFSGSILGGALVGVLGGKIKNKITMLILATAGFGLTTLIMGFSPNFWFYLGVMLPMGVVMPFINTSSMTVLQMNVKKEFIGRIFGLVTIIGSSAMPLSMLAFGPLADFVSIEAQLIITGAFMIGISFIMLFFKEVREIGDTPAIEQ